MSDYLQLSSICNRPAVPLLNQSQLIYILTEILPGKGLSNVRLPLNFVLVLDRSGSMAGSKLRTMKEAVNRLIDQLNADDIISIVTFETKTQLLVPAQAALNKSELKRLVDKIEDGGGTNLATGLREGINQVSKNLVSERTSRIILLTDGEATDEEDDSRKEADRAASLQIPIIGLGFGKDWNEEFLIDLSDRSILAPGTQTGSAFYIPSPDQAAQIFQMVFQSMQVVAQDLTITIRMVQGLEARHVWQVVPTIKEIGMSAIQGRAIVIPAGQLEKSGAAFLAEIMLPPRPEGSVRIAQTEVAYAMPAQGLNRENVDLVVRFSPDAALTSQVNGHVMNVLEKVQAFKLQTRAMADAETGNIGHATQKLRQAVTILLSQGETELAHQMEQEADQLEQTGQISSEGKKTIKLTSRHTVKLSDNLREETE